MLNFFFKQLGQFAVIMLIQVMIMSNINLGGYINPYIYVLFILLLPFEIKGWALLLAAFFTGLIIDLFSDTFGMHAAASVFMAFARPGIISLLTIRSDFEPDSIPQISTMGTKWVIMYTATLVLLHHSLLFFLEIFRFSGFLVTISRILASSGITFIMVLLGFLFLDRPGKRGR